MGDRATVEQSSVAGFSRSAYFVVALRSFATPPRSRLRRGLTGRARAVARTGGCKRGARRARLCDRFAAQSCS